MMKRYGFEITENNLLDEGCLKCKKRMAGIGLQGF